MLLHSLAYFSSHAPEGCRTECCNGSSSHVIKIDCSCCYFCLCIGTLRGFWEGNLDLLGAAIYWDLCLLFFSLLLDRLPPVSAVTLLQAEQFAWELRFHPDRQKVNFVLEGLRYGFHLGFLLPKSSSLQRKISHLQISIPPDMNDQYLANEVSLGEVAGPFSASPFPDLHVSSFGLFLKEEEANQVSGTSLLTFPPWAGLVSIMGLTWTNSPSITSHSKSTVSKLGPRALMAKFDVEVAYLQCACTPLPSHSSGDEAARPILCGLGSPFCPSISSFYFQLHCRQDGMDPCQVLPDSRPPPLLGRLHYRRPPSVPPVCIELDYYYATLSMAWSTFASWQVCGPFYSACCPGDRAQLLQSSGTSSAGEAVSIAKFDWFLAPSEMVQVKSSNHYWSLASCCQSARWCGREELSYAV